MNYQTRTTQLPEIKAIYNSQEHIHYSFLLLIETQFLLIKPFLYSFFLFIISFQQLIIYNSNEQFLYSISIQNIEQILAKITHRIFMLRSILLLCILLITQSQIKIVAHPALPTYTSANIYAIDVNDDGTQILASIYQNNTKIVRMNVQDPINVTRIGQYVPATILAPSLGFNNIYLVKGYLIASNSNTTYPLIFNQSSYALVGQFDRQINLFSLKYVQSQNIIIFGSSDGKTYYSSMTTFPNPVSNLIHNIGTVSSGVFVDVSYDQVYFSTVYSNNTALVIFNLTDFTIVYSAVTDCYSNTQIWSPDSRYVVAFPYCHSTFTLYDRNNSWAKFQKFPGNSWIRFTFNSLDTNALVIVPLSNNLIITMNWFDWQFSSITNFTFTGKFGKISKIQNVFGVFSQSAFQAWFFQINSFCQPYFGFKISTKTCVPCSANCLKCSDTTVCTRCISNYSLFNSSCQTCPPNSIYNSTTYLCDDISSLCSGSNYYSIALSACIQCDPNCIQCASVTSCQVCALSYVVTNGSCINIDCGQGLIFNQTTNLCQSCPYNCLKCINSNQCISCESDNVLAGGICKPSHQVIFQQVIKNTLQSDVMKISNRIPGNRVLLNQVFSMFVNIDHLWLYIYHKRLYGSIFTNLLNSVNDLEQQKWQFINKDAFFEKIAVPIGDMEEKLNFKQNQTSWKFQSIENQSSSFLENALIFFILNLPFVLFLYLFFRGVFIMTITYKISSLFRQYVFDLFFFHMLLQGNLQSFTYYIFYDYLEMTSSNNFEKFINFLTLMFAFILFIYIFGGQLTIYKTQGKHSKYFMKDFKVNLKSVFFVTFHVGIFNFCLGAAHILAQNYYLAQLAILAFTEALYISLLALVLKENNIFIQKYVGWQHLFGSFLRTVLILTFRLDKQSEGKIRQLLNLVHMMIMVLYLLNWILSICIGYGDLIREVLGLLIRKITGKNESKKILGQVDEKSPLIIQSLLKEKLKKEQMKNKARHSMALQFLKEKNRNSSRNPFLNESMGSRQDCAQKAKNEEQEKGHGRQSRWKKGGSKMKKVLKMKSRFADNERNGLQEQNTKQEWNKQNKSQSQQSFMGKSSTIRKSSTKRKNSTILKNSTIRKSSIIRKNEIKQIVNLDTKQQRTQQKSKKSKINRGYSMMNESDIKKSRFGPPEKGFSRESINPRQSYLVRQYRPQFQSIIRQNKRPSNQLSQIQQIY